MSNLKITTLGLAAAASLAFITVVVVVAALTTIRGVNSLGNYWAEFESQPARKIEYLQELNAAIGYGGMIHQFKNYILRQERSRIVKVQTKLRAATVALLAYQAIGVNAKESAALRTISVTLVAYMDALAVAEKLAAEGKRPQAIDEATKIDDGPALKAIAVLNRELTKARQSSSENVYGAVERLSTFAASVSIVVGIMLIVLLVFLVWFASFRLGRPLRTMVDVMVKLADGDHQVKVPATDRGDEIGEMARTLQVFRSNKIELALHQNYLEKLVEERTVEIEVQSKELMEALAREKELNEMQRQFVAMASHEFRTPLAIIDGTAQRILRRLDHLTPQEVEKRIAKIRGAVVRMVGLIDSTLSAARLDAGTIKVNFMPCNLSNLISQVAKRQMGIAKSHSISVTTSGLPETISADSSQLDQVFTNLLSNSVKYSPTESDIDVKLWPDGRYVAISIRDRGLGIPADELPRMFERYFRASTSTGIAGTGIGLNLVKQLVEMHGGSIEVESIEGEGSTFTVRLPIEQSIAPQEEPQVDKKEPKTISATFAGEVA